MSLKVFPDNHAMSLAAAEWIADFVRVHPTALFSFAAGKTQAATYEILGQWVQEGKLDLSRIRVVGLDDMVGTSRTSREGFYYFLDEHLFKRANIADEQVTFFNPQAADLAAECQRIDAYLDANGPIDFLILGIGMNGHIGYNEPGSTMNDRSHVVALESSSVQVGSAYFDHEVSTDSGITLGLRDLFAARNILVQANQAKKAEIVKTVIEGPITDAVPATLLRNRADVAWYLDADCATLLSAT